ncbi:MAG: ComEC/Rec2 family competence protein [Acidimicrobiales bacterium]
MSDRWWLAAAAVAWAGALHAHPVAWWVLGIVVVVVVVLRRPILLCALLGVLTATLADRALDGLVPPPDDDFAGTVTILTDPEPTPGGRLRLEVDTDLGRLLAEVRSPTAVAALENRLAGDRAQVRGTSAAFGRVTEWLRSRHLAGRLRIESVEAVGGGARTTEAANHFRRVLDRGAASLSERHRSLLSGLVLGDDRAQPPELTADFRAAGLTHLLAVSGQNVAFVLVVVGPLLCRLRIWPRYLLAVGVIAAFALVTRFEPSVVRAAFVAGVALFARTTGRPSGGLRHLSMAVCLLLVVDPLLVHALGFRLSVAASAGVLLIAPVIVGRLPGPRWIAEGLGVTTGAQLAVAPVLVPVLGPMPLAALPANIVAGPLAAALMVWGLAAGIVAGLVEGPPAMLLHLPSRAGLAAMEAVARSGASLPLGRIDLRHVAVVTLAAGVVRWGAEWGRWAGVALLAVVVAAPLLTPVPLGERPAGFDARIWVDGPLAVVDVGSRATPVDVLDALRSSHVAAVGLVVLRTAQPSVVEVVDAIGARFPTGAVIGPPGLDLADVVVPTPGFRARVGRFRVVVDRPGPPMRVRIGWVHEDEVAAFSTAIGSAGALGARLPPVRRHPPGDRHGDRRPPGVGSRRHGSARRDTPCRRRRLPQSRVLADRGDRGNGAPRCGDRRSRPR